MDYEVEDVRQTGKTKNLGVRL